MFNFRRNSNVTPTDNALPGTEIAKPKFIDTTKGVVILGIAAGLAVGAILVVLNRGVENLDVN